MELKKIIHEWVRHNSTISRNEYIPANPVHSNIMYSKQIVSECSNSEVLRNDEFSSDLLVVCVIVVTVVRDRHEQLIGSMHEIERLDVSLASELLDHVVVGLVALVGEFHLPNLFFCAVQQESLGDFLIEATISSVFLKSVPRPTIANEGLQLVLTELLTLVPVDSALIHFCASPSILFQFPTISTWALSTTNAIFAIVITLPSGTFRTRIRLIVSERTLLDSITRWFHWNAHSQFTFLWLANKHSGFRARTNVGVFLENVFIGGYLHAIQLVRSIITISSSIAQVLVQNACFSVVTHCETFSAVPLKLPSYHMELLVSSRLSPTSSMILSCWSFQFYIHTSVHRNHPHSHSLHRTWTFWRHMLHFHTSRNQLSSCVCKCSSLHQLRSDNRECCHTSIRLEHISSSPPHSQIHLQKHTSKWCHLTVPEFWIVQRLSAQTLPSIETELRKEKTKQRAWIFLWREVYFGLQRMIRLANAQFMR